MQVEEEKKSKGREKKPSRRAASSYSYSVFCPMIPFPETIQLSPTSAKVEALSCDGGGGFGFGFGFGEGGFGGESNNINNHCVNERRLKTKMAPQYPWSSSQEDGMHSPRPHANATAVGIDKDKNSSHAVKYAIDYVLNNHQPNPTVILIHVRHKINYYNQASPVNNDSGSGEVTESDLQQLFSPYRGYCARRGVQLKEVVVNEDDVTKGLVDYINLHYINTIVVGASTKNAIARKLAMKSDVATSLAKAAPPFCSLYVIAKQKAVMVRLALRPAANTAAPPRQPSPVGMLPPHLSPDYNDLNDSSRGQQVRSGYRSPGSERGYSDRSPEHVRGPTRERPRSAPVNLSMDSIDLPSRGSRASSRDSFSDDNLDFSGSLNGFGSMDMSSHNSDFSYVSDSSRDSSSAASSRELEAEMRRLKLELKQTMNMYSSACKEAISAKQKAKELNEWKREEVRRFEEARQAEEAALALAEMEKAKCKAAIEAAEAAQKLAEMEGQRRRHAEFKAKRESEEKNKALNALAQNDVRYRKYTIEEIEEATGEFTESNKIGEGGYGPVYKANLDHTPVAIKVLRPDAAQGRKQFQQEVEVLCCIRHPNMVLLLGACPEYGCLVYEYMENGSLEDRLLRRGNTPPISWRTRFKLAAEIATALLFLHQSKPEPLVHRDLKPANILLDRNYVSKISDVGLARLVPPSVADSVTQYHMTSAAGTFCYIDPEYQQTGMLTTKSDIYSFGIMLLQIVTAKPAMGLTHHVQRAIEKGKFADMLDPAVSDWPAEEALAFAKLALKCAELRKKDRPDLAADILPELNRFRDLGRSHESNSNSYHGRGHGQRSRPSSQSRLSTSSQESSRSNDEGSRSIDVVD